MSREPLSLPALIRRKTVRTAGFAIGFGVTMAVGVTVYADAFDGITDMGAQTSESPASVADHPSPPSRVERLIERHSCWSGEGPAGVVPERAVVTLPGARAEVVHADVGFGIWLEGEPGTLHAFCR